MKSDVNRFTSYGAWWIGWTAVSLLLAGPFSWTECMAGAVVAALTTAAMHIGSVHTRPFSPSLGWLAKLRGVPGQVLADCGLVAMALWRRGMNGEDVSGSLRRIPFDPGGDDGRSAARRAIVAGALSLAPNTCVVAIHRRHRAVTVHQLVSDHTPGHGERRWPL
ncbi:MAG TPA: hypothetical protein VJV04_07980 [Nitrospiraceae bacterium]|nr:hypothetical protein [Nitrospiraceae bacterium]